MKHSYVKIVCAMLFSGLLSCIPMPANAQIKGTQAAPMPSLQEPALDRLAAPVALYPDALLAQLLMAATYPLDVAEAARWAARHPSSSAKEIAAQRWKASVKALLPFAPVLNFLDKEKAWSKQLAAAVVEQPDALLQTMQALRQRAYDNGALPPGADSGRHQQAQRQDRVITIEPVDRRTLYVPYYDPAKVYGAAGNSMLSPEYWAAQPYAAPQNKPAGVVFSIGIPVRDRAFYDARIDWRSSRLMARQTAIDGNGATAGLAEWRHDPQYRKHGTAAAAAGKGNSAGNGYSIGTEAPPDTAGTISTRDAGSAPQAPGGYRISTQPRRSGSGM
ncbi:DUF3300 domain-containing protein [Oxalobacteraceae bacterium CAVE-383]|nr:DUF3300 domain-containing protein [Oxalobacteraceae bacterium CAVE-383]